MPEQFQSNTEFITEAAKQEAINAYKSFLEKGIFNPSKLDAADPDVIKADELFEKWREALASKTNMEDPDAVSLIILESQTFFIDAGFLDPTYLAEVRDEITAGIEHDFSAEQEDETQPPIHIVKINEKLAQIDQLFSVHPGQSDENVIDLEYITDQQLMHLLQYEQQRQRELPVKEAVFKWFMRRLDEVEKSADREIEKEKLKIEVAEMLRNVTGWYEWLFTLSLVYLKGEIPRPIDKKLLSKLDPKYKSRISKG